MIMANSTMPIQWDDAPDLLKLQEAAQLLRVGKNRIGEISRRKGFPKLYIGDKRFLIPKNLLLQWVEKATVTK